MPVDQIICLFKEDHLQVARKAVTGRTWLVTTEHRSKTSKSYLVNKLCIALTFDISRAPNRAFEDQKLINFLKTPRCCAKYSMKWLTHGNLFVFSINALIFLLVIRVQESRYGDMPMKRDLSVNGTENQCEAKSHFVVTCVIQWVTHFLKKNWERNH